MIPETFVDCIVDERHYSHNYNRIDRIITVVRIPIMPTPSRVELYTSFIILSTVRCTMSGEHTLTRTSSTIELISHAMWVELFGLQ